MVKWKLMLSTLPFVAVALVIKAILDFVIRFEGVVEFGDVGLVLTSAVFLIGFMLAGVMSDYKESEKLPAEVACSLETLEESLEVAAAAKPDLDMRALRQKLLELTNSVNDWLTRRIPPEQIFDALSAFGSVAVQLDRAGVAGHAARLLSELHGLRKTITRISVISRTGFLASGYALLETLVVSTVLLLMVSRFKNVVSEYTLISCVTLIFVYMVRLIRDLDDPFEYDPKGSRGAADVELFPLVEYRQRLQARVNRENTGTRRPAPVALGQTTKVD